ncbi:MAG: hypothetical protein SFU86_09750 [Pirellulaceae bacterium]|nr:hypothetical protein [Pirellulaceae bacterium]
MSMLDGWRISLFIIIDEKNSRRKSSPRARVRLDETNPELVESIYRGQLARSRGNTLRLA